MFYLNIWIYKHSWSLRQQQMILVQVSQWFTELLLVWELQNYGKITPWLLLLIERLGWVFKEIWLQKLLLATYKNNKLRAFTKTTKKLVFFIGKYYVPTLVSVLLEKSLKLLDVIFTIIRCSIYYH